MNEVFYAVAVLACPVGMGLMMWFMTRGNTDNKAPASQRGGSGPSDADAELADLRAELDQLRAARRDHEASRDQTTGSPGRTGSS